ncbi:16S rRNA (cytidine(1402)-2'-O)-methyltransferase [Thalassobacillus hwangdonensis]|uniref:Ribosomal RNA small subunit methyltransferase I n=1 Tax=Thalassobacillus hwangdonensis TaxID=546108 RepID=A0ABW3L7F8_9BACI
MKIQKSYAGDTDYGTLYIVPTPIGNLEDMTFRAVRLLKEADVIAAEDTRNTKKLLNHFDIQNELISYHEHNKQAREDALLNRLEKGESIAVVSDAGMPGVSDPGFELVKAAVGRDIPVVVLPGANAALCALVGSGLQTDTFHFHGFLPRKKKEREAELVELKKIRSTIIFYESPHRLKEMLKALHEVFGDRSVALSRELTKKYEEFIRGSMTEVREWAEEQEIRGEFCVIVEGTEEDQVDDVLWWSALSVIDHVTHYIESEDMSSKDAIKAVATERKLPKREVYQAYHIND